MPDELMRRQRCRDRLYPDSWIHCRVRPVTPEMRRQSLLRIALDRDRFTLQGAHQDFFARYPIECEPARVAPFQLRGKPFAPSGIPHYLGRRESLAYRVEHVKQHAVELN